MRTDIPGSPGSVLQGFNSVHFGVPLQEGQGLMGVPQPLQGQCWGEAKAGKRGFILHAAPWEREFIFQAAPWEKGIYFPCSTLGKGIYFPCNILGKGIYFSRQHLGKHLQPLRAGLDAPAANPGAGLSLLTKPPQKRALSPLCQCQGSGRERSRQQRGREVTAGTDVYVGQGEPPGPGFTACGFSRLTGGQWAGARAGLGPAGLSHHPGLWWRFSWAGQT